MPAVSGPRRILFVCMGNIIRSPLAEHLFRHLAMESRLDGKVEVDSAGTGGWHAGEAPDARMRRTAAGHGLKYTGEARQVRLRDFEEFDLILAMDTDNLAELRSRARGPGQLERIRLLRDYDPEAGRNASVPDPYYGGDEAFEETYAIVERGVRGLIHNLESGGA